MKWEEVRYPYSYNEKEKDYMDNVAIPNFEKFVKMFGIDKMSIFNYGYNPKEVFERKSPRYDYRGLECFSLPDHANYYFRNSQTGETYLVAFPYGEYNIKDFLEKYDLEDVIFNEQSSFYHNKGTRMIVIKKKQVERYMW